MRNPQQPGLPSIHQHHHHSMHSSLGGNQLPGPQSQSLVSHQGGGRPEVNRAHTFPTPPTSASGVIGSMGSQDGSFNWGGQNINGSVQSTNPLSIDTGLSNARSMPTTPATTPPGAPIQSMQQQYQQNSQHYDTSRQMYSAAPQQSPYPAATSQRYSQPTSYIKSEMGPPSGRTPGPGPETEQHDVKPANGLMHHANEQVGHATGDEEAEHEHDSEYTHDSGAGYDASRGSYSYNSAPAVGSIAGEHQHLSPEMAGSPNHQANSGRATPRTTTAPQSYYQQQQGYGTPPRVQPPSSNLYSVMSSERGTANGGPGGNAYADQSNLGSSISNGYPAQDNILNGTSTSNKRGRDDDDDSSSRDPSGNDLDGLKRRKTMESAPGQAYDRPRQPIRQGRR